MAQGQFQIRLAEQLRTNETDSSLILGNDGAGIVVWKPVPSSPSAWGLITGTLSDQTDLQDALNLKATVINFDAHVADVANPHVVTQTQVGLGNVDNTSDVNKPISSLTQTALDQKASSASISVIGFSGNVNDIVVSGGDLVGNIMIRDTTSSFIERTMVIADVADLPSALSDKADDIALTNHINNNANPHGVNTVQLGLQNVDNTSDANKPISTATQSQLDLKELSANKGVPLGYCELDGSGLVPQSRISIDALIFLGTWDAFNNTPTLSDGGSGTDGEFYIVDVAGTTPIDGEAVWNIGDWIITEGLVWSRIENVQNISTVFGRTGAVVAVSGDYDADQIDETASSKILTITERDNIVLNNAHRVSDGTDHSEVVNNVTHRGVVSGNPHNVNKGDVGLGNVDNTSDLNKPISTLTQIALDLKADLSTNIDFFNDVTYTAPALGEVLYRSGGVWINQQLVKADVGLDMVDNTADLDKPISTLTQNAIDQKADASPVNSHIADATIHFTEASIDHANILNIGTNTHAQIDTHLALILNPHGSALAQDMIDLTVTTAPAHKEGRIFYDNDRKTFSVYNDAVDMTLNVGEENVVRVINNTGVAIPNGSLVRVSGASGTLPTVVLAQADTIDNATGLIGACTHDIADGAVGYVTTLGSVGGLNTLGLVAGSILYLSDSVAGGYTQTEQQILHPMGLVVFVDGAEGTIYISPRGIKNISAVGQVRGSAFTQAVSATPAKLYAFALGEFELNVDINQTENPLAPVGYDAVMSPISVGASGFYRFFFNTSFSATANAVYTIELYIDGVGTGVLANLDLVNNNVSAGTCAFTGVSEAVVTDANNIEIYIYTDGGASTITYASSLFGIERIGNV